MTLEFSKSLRHSMAQIQKATLDIMEAAKKDGNRELALEAAREGRENVRLMRLLLVKSPDGKTKGKPGAEAPALSMEQGERMTQIYQSRRRENHAA
jgi:hypothetical protein